MAWTTLPGVERLRASILSAAITELRPLYALVTTNQDVGNSNTTFTDITELAIAVAANTTYEIRAFIQYSSNSTADIKIQFTLPAGATMDVLGIGLTAAEAITFFRNTGGSAALGGSVNGILYGGTVTIGATAGTLQMQAAQNTSTAVSTLVEAGSYIGLQKIA